MRKAALGLVLLASIFLAGCPVTDLLPLYNSSDAITEPALVGKWAMQDPSEKGSISFEKTQGNAYAMVLNDPDQGVADTYEVHLVRLGGNLYADIRFSKRTRGGNDKNNDEDMPIGMISAHMIAKLQIAKDDLAFATMEDDALKKNSATDKPSLAYLDYEPDGILVTSDTDALRRYVLAHASDGFSEVEHWRRVSK
jgi:hypothetical protein